MNLNPKHPRLVLGGILILSLSFSGCRTPRSRPGTVATVPTPSDLRRTDNPLRSHTHKIPEVRIKYRGFMQKPISPSAAGKRGDLNADGVVDEADVHYIYAAWWVQNGGNGDLNADAVVDRLDVDLVTAAWGPCVDECPEDLNEDGLVDEEDLKLVSWAYWVSGGGDGDLNQDGTVDAHDVVLVLEDQYPDEDLIESKMFPIVTASLERIVKGEKPLALSLTDVKAVPAGEMEELTTTFQIHEHVSHSGIQLAQTHNEDWSSGWTHMKSYQVDGSHYAIFLKSQTGNATVVRLNNNGSISGQVGTYNFHQDITNMEIIRRDGKNPRLLLHKRINGKVIVRRIQDTGEIGPQLSSGVHDHLTYKDIVRPYQTSNGNLYLFSLSRWYGSVAIHPLQTSGAMADDQAPSYQNSLWKNGWSSAELYRHEGQNYLVVYKIMSNPAGNGGGKVRVKRLLNNGTIADGNHQVPGDGTWTEGYSHLRVIHRRVPDLEIDDIQVKPPEPPIANSNTNFTTGGRSTLPLEGNPALVDANLLLLYKIHNGNFKVLRLTENGISTEVGSGNLGSGWTEIEPYMSNGKLFVAKINEENRIPFDFNMVKAFEASLQGEWEQNQLRGGGYQVGLMQSGRILYLRAAGFAKRSTGKKLKTYHRSGIASVSKLFTSFTVIKMIENGEFGLYDRLLDHFFDLPEGPSPQISPISLLGRP